MSYKPKDQKPKRGQRTGKGHIDKETKRRAFELYAVCRNCEQVARELGLKPGTVRDWRKKQHWEDIIRKQMRETGLVFGTRKMEVKNTMQRIIEESEYDDLTSTVMIPSAVRDIIDVPAPTEDDIMNLAAFNYFLSQYHILTIIERKLSESLRTMKAKPDNWNEILKTADFLSTKFRQLREDLIKSGFANKFKDEEKDTLEASYYIGEIEED